MMNIFGPSQEVEKRFPHGLPLLDPVVDMHIKDEDFRKIVKVRLYLHCT